MMDITGFIGILAVRLVIHYGRYCCKNQVRTFMVKLNNRAVELCLLCCLSWISCKKLGLCKDATLSINKSTISTSLRMDGYYYGLPQYDNFYDTVYSVIFLFHNGVFLQSSFSGGLEKINEFEDRINNGLAERHIKSYWGIYKIQNDSILVQGWVPSMSCFKSYSSYYLMLDDSTLFYRSDTMLFKQFFPKPDSTNDFIQ
jgi:hypothetical protein